MDYQVELLTEARKAVAELPEHRGEIIELYRLAMDEIGDGESAAREYELFMADLEEIHRGITP